MFNENDSNDFKGHIVFKQRSIRWFKKSTIIIFLNVFISIIVSLIVSFIGVRYYIDNICIKGENQFSTKYDYNITNVINKLNQSIVGINAYVKNSEKSDLNQINMSGIFYSEDGYIVTNFEGLHNADKIYVKFPTALNLTKEAKIVGYNEEYDLCLLKINGFGYMKGNFSEDLSDISHGLKVISIGNPSGRSGSYTIYHGIVNGLFSSRDSENKDMRLIRSDFCMDSMNSGGPICDINGEIIGINSIKINNRFIDSGYGSTYISSQDIIKIIEDIIESATSN